VLLPHLFTLAMLWRSVATKILINTEVSAMLNPNEYGNECEVLSESESESESEI